jgi:hypothetical protein
MIANTLPIIINPSLQAAAQRMEWPEFNAMTEQVRDFLLAGDHKNLTRVLEGRAIDAHRGGRSPNRCGPGLFFRRVTSENSSREFRRMPAAQRGPA